MGLSQIFESFLLNRTASGTTEFFMVVILCCFASALFAARRGKAPRFTAYAPTLLTSLGILGTFVGIVIGLLNFEPAQLDASIGKLLDGLKTAFITSITGMSLGILFKAFSTTPWLRPVEAEPEIEVGPTDILAKLEEQTRLLEATRDAVAGNEESSLAGQMKLLRTDTLAKLEEQTRLLEATRDAVAGNEESSLAGQMKLLRTDLADWHRDDRQAFNSFADDLQEQLKDVAQMLSKAATEQIVDALRQVIADFNQKITEQFGDNFKKLDASVQKLVDWQEHYREQLAQLHALYDQSVQSITKIDEAVAHIAESSSSIPNSMEKLAGIVETASHQLAELERHLESFAQMRDRALEAVPQMQAHVEETTRAIAASVDIASEHYKKLLADSDRYIQAQDAKAQELLRTLTDAVERTQRALQEEHQQLLQGLDIYRRDQDKVMRETLATFTDASERIQRNIQTAQQEFADGTRRIQDRIEASANEMIEAQNKAINQGVERLRSLTEKTVNSQLEAIDQALTQEMERVMNEMGRALAQITGKFTEDYSELTEAMRRIVEQGRGLR